MLDCLLQAFARAMLDGECWTTEVATLTGINTEAEIRSIEGCETRDSARGNAAGSTSGSTAEGVRTLLHDPVPDTSPCMQSCRCLLLILTRCRYDEC